MQAKPLLIFRADGNSQIGLGHVVRSLALAELLRSDFHCQFAIQNPSETLKTQILSVCEDIIVLKETEENQELLEEAKFLANQFSGQEIIVLDGYRFPSEYQQILKSKGSLLVCLDDLHDRKFVADAIINIAGGVKTEKYQAAPYTRLCIGPEYALLRQPFSEAQQLSPMRVGGALHILLCFGGADPENFTLNYTRNLLALEIPMQLEIVTGSAYKHSDELQEFLSDKENACWHKNLNAEQMADLMKKCAVAVCSASSVAYEYCAVSGLLFVVQTAANQADLYAYLTSEGLALASDRMEQVLISSGLHTQSQQLTKNQRRIFNGNAEENLRKLFDQLKLQAQLRFRKVNAEDAKLLFDWANDPVVRQFSFNPEPIAYETHVKWLSGKLSNSDALLLLAEIEEQSVALLRFDRNGNTALISYQIGADFRGKGLGHRVLQQGLRELKKYFPDVKEAIGYVQPQNIASVRAFEKAEFVNSGIDKAQHGAYKFIFPII